MSCESEGPLSVMGNTPTRQSSPHERGNLLRTDTLSSPHIDVLMCPDLGWSIVELFRLKGRGAQRRQRTQESV
jgi:hypothetical protein